MKVLNFGSLNLDYVYQVEHFVQPDETLSVMSQTVNPGSKGLNQSIALSKAGAEVSHAGCLGLGGEVLGEILQKNGVETDYLYFTDSIQGNAVIQVNAEGQNCILLFGGSNQCVTDAQVTETLSHFAPGDYLILQNEINNLSLIVDEAFHRCMKIVMNPSPYNEKLRSDGGAQFAGLHAARQHGLRHQCDACRRGYVHSGDRRSGSSIGGKIMKAINLKTAHLKNPLGIDVRKPLLSWTCEGGERQTAYQIRAFAWEKEIWNSGKVESNSMQAVYEGLAESRLRIEWTIRLWDENGVEDEEAASWFEYALLQKSDYKARWINPETGKINPKKRQPASVLKREFTLDTIGNARIYATAHGVYVLYINGRRVTENVLTPGTSEYWFRLPVQTFDISDYLTVGRNTIEVTLGDGWWRGCNGNTGTLNVFGKDIALLLQLEVNGETKLISDETWLAAQDGPVRFNDLQLGERVDARMEPKNWHCARVENFGYDNFICANTLPLKEKESFSARLIRTPSGKTVLDFGQNMAGYVSFKLNARAGQTVKLTHGEYIGADGEFSDSNLQTVGRKTCELHQVVEYICKDGLNEYTPTLCIFGFQYVLVETDLPIDGSEFTAHAVYSDMDETASFTCDHPLIDQLFRNAVWSEKSNFVDIPTDCPQRERSGWTGDAGLYCHTGIRLMDAYPVYARWLAECRVDQYPDGKVCNISPRRTSKPSFFDTLYDGSCAWGDAAVIVPYEMYRLLGDKAVLEENWDFMSRWMGYCEKKARKSRLKNRFHRNEHSDYIIDTGIHWGEWLEAGVSMADSTKAMLFEGVPDIATAYFAQSCRMMHEIAEILEKPDQAKKYAALYDKVNAAYHSIELPDGQIRSERQCRYVRPLQMGLLTKREAKTAAKDLNDLIVKNGYHLNTGFLTTAHLCRILADNGYVETAYRLLLQEDNPGWLYQVKQGATTIWESWEGNTGSTGVASLNHYSKGAVVSWFIEGICGIRVSNGKIEIRPQPHQLMQHAEAVFDSPLGRIESAWKYVGDKVEYTVTIPANTTAEFFAPDEERTMLRAGQNRITCSTLLPRADK